MTTVIDRAAAISARYVSVTTAGEGQSSPILFASNPMGDALLSTGLMTLAGASAAAMVPVLPVRMSGIQIREAVHRLAATAQTPWPERGITSANRIGERLGEVTMRWLVAPDGFDATPSALPPDTELEASASQRFVMPDGVLRFQDHTGSGVRFFGAGRTYPTHSEGTSRLLFAGAAAVVEGLGGLKGIRGTLTLAGEVSGRSLVSFTLCGRFDDDGPLEATDRLPAIAAGDVPPVGPAATILMFIGEPDGRSGTGVVDELLQAVSIENDLAHGTRPRSFVHVGDSVGRVTGPLQFDPADRRCAIRLHDGRRQFTFFDAGGQPIASINADVLEGSAFRSQQGGEQVSRLAAYGSLSSGTGTLAGAGGVMTLDTAVSADGRAASTYVLRLVDPHGRFRATVDDETPTPERIEPPASAMRVADVSAGSMSAVDLTVLAHAERAVGEGNELLAWFKGKEHAGDFAERFEVAREQLASESFGFFDSAEIAGRQVPIMGVVQDLAFDRMKDGNAESIREQLRTFVLHYFLRVCGGYEQVYYRLAGTGEVGKFDTSDRGAIVDAREIGSNYDWVVLKQSVLTYDLPLAPFGSDAPRLQVPGHAPAYLVMSSSFVDNVDKRERGVLGDYGVGYAFVPYATDASGVLAYGPGRFRVAIQIVRFSLMADGEIRARAALVANRPEKISAVDVDPIGWSVQIADLLTFRMASRLMAPFLAMTDRLPLRASGVDPVAAYIWMANAMTGGLAETHFGISKVVLEKRMLLQHLRQHQDMLRGSLQVWRTVQDWTLDAQLPDYCRRGWHAEEHS